MKEINFYKHIIRSIIMLLILVNLVIADIIPVDLFRKKSEIKAWIFLKKDTFTAQLMKPAEYPERTHIRLKKLDAMGNRFDDLVPEAALRREIESRAIKIHRYSRCLVAFSADINRQNFTDLMKLPYIEKIVPVRTLVKKRPDIRTLQKQTENLGYGNYYGPSLNQLQQLNIPAVHQSGVTGKGVLITFIDTGFRKDHNCFKKVIEEGRLLGERDFINNDSNVQNELPEDTTLYGQSQHSHGTAVWSLVGGYVADTLIGAAYGADFLLAKTEVLASETRVEEDNFVAAVEWADSCGADIISTSLGYRDFDDFEYAFEELDGETAITSIIANWAFGRGILFVTAAGNDRQYFIDGGIITPGDAWGALTVGAVDENGMLGSFSSHGPTADGRIKPDLCARGVATFYAHASDKNNYISGNGTSFATPLIAGSTALVLESNPEATPREIIAELKKRASFAGNPDQLYGWGIPDIRKTINEITYPEIELRSDEILAYPNPSNSSINFYYQWNLNKFRLNKNTSIAVLDILGREVWSRNIVVGINGAKEISSWKLVDNYGKEVPSGLYFVKINYKNMQAFGKFLICR